METILKGEKLGKSYSGNSVLRDIDIELNKGEIVGLIGENGAGKSTLMKLIAGVEKPSTGAMWLHGKPYVAHSIIDANIHGVGMVFQEQSLVANLTVAQNIYLGREHLFKRFGLVNWKQMNKEAAKALHSAGVDNIDAGAKVESLPFALREMVEIAKVLNIVDRPDNEGAVILLDEATTVLSDEEIQILFTQMRKMAAKGNAIVFISHRLDEILEICDRIYVFKDGNKTANVTKQEATIDLLYNKMVGSNSVGEYYVTAKQTIASEEIVLEAKKISRFGEFNNVDFKLYRGEVLSICGVEGSGKESLCGVLCGDLELDHGEINLCGKKVVFSSPCAALKKGILSVPKDRRDEGIIGMLDITDNIIVSSLDKLAVGNVFLSIKKTQAIAREWVKKLSIKCTGIKARIATLSGGNAQKVIFARAIQSGASVVILNHPTRGVDVGAKAEIYALVRDLTNSGCSVILLGDTLDEAIGLASRIIVMEDGLVTGEFACPADDKPAQIDIIRLMM